MVTELITDQKKWDDFVEGNSKATLMHRWNFLKIVEKHTGYRLLTYGIYHDDELQCIIPLFYKKILFQKLLFSPPPQSGITYLGFVFRDSYFGQRADQKETFLKTIFTDFEKEVRRINPSYLLITSVPDLKDFRFLNWLKYELATKYTYILDLELPIEQLLKNMKDKRRQKISKAKRENIDISEIENSDIVYKFMSETYEGQGLHLPLISCEYLNDLKREFPENILFRVARQGEKIVGSEALINYKQTHINWLGASKTDDKLPTNELLIWDYVEKAKKQNMKTFDLSGANNENISFFKSQFGPELIQYFILKRTNLAGKILETAYLRFVKKSLI